MYEISREFRSGHSINNTEITEIIKYVKDNNVKKFLDYGCHFGHLSVELALNFDIEIMAVDNFTGTIDDSDMILMLKNMKQQDFFNLTERNVKKYQDLYKGKIALMRSTDWHNSKFDQEYDMVFVDSSHRPEESNEFISIKNSLKIGGIFSGHDWVWNGVQDGYKLIQDSLSELEFGPSKISDLPTQYFCKRIK